MPITTAQLESRRNHIGSSDMAGLLGLDPFKNAYDIWLSKTGKLEETNGNDAMYAGQMFEDGVLQYAESELGKLTRNQYRSAKDRGIPLGANIDAIVVQTGMPVEAKTAGLFGPLTELWGQPGTDEIPDRVIIQATVHMVCSATEVCHVAAFLGGRGFQMFVINRDPVIADVVTETAVNFWNNHVLADVPPDGSLPHASVIKSIRREPESMTAINTALVENWLAAKEDLKNAEAIKSDAEAAMLIALGQSEGGRCDNGVLTYLSRSRTTIDAKTLRADLPNIYEQYAKTSTYRVARFKADK